MLRYYNSDELSFKLIDKPDYCSVFQSPEEGFEKQAHIEGMTVETHLTVIPLLVSSFRSLTVILHHSAEYNEWCQKYCSKLLLYQSYKKK